MGSRFLQLVDELRRVRAILRPIDFVRWLWIVLRSSAGILRSRSLGAADTAFGMNVQIRLRGRSVRIANASFGVIREIFGHRCYGDISTLRDCRAILDLGANAGTFTLYALLAAPRATVHAVEAQPQFIDVIRSNLENNKLSDRVTIENSIVGGACNEWTADLRRLHPTLNDFSIERYIESVGECDFMKCDVEGAEFVLFDGACDWLDRVRHISLEYHGTWNDGIQLATILRQHGFTVTQKSHGALGYLFADRTK